MRILVQIFCVLGLMGLGSVAVAERLTVFAAASLKAPMDQIVDAFQAKTGAKLAVSYAASSTLARQIEFGAPADVFLSADNAWMQHLMGQGILEASAIREVARNRLILGGGEAVPFDAMPANLNGKIAAPLLDAVPLGRYAKAAMERHGWLPAIAPQLVQTDNALTTKTLLLRREVSFAFLYASDAADGAVQIVHQFGSADHPPIIYQAGVIKADNALADQFVAFVKGAIGQKILTDHGFQNAV